MKVVLFCGGLGLRLREHSESLPKPMVTVGDRPILWHVMRITLLRLPRLRPLPGVSGRRDQGVFP